MGCLFVMKTYEDNNLNDRMNSHAHWILKEEVDSFGDHFRTYIICSRCNHLTFKIWNFCPDCGSIMDEDTVEDNDFSIKNVSDDGWRAIQILLDMRAGYSIFDPEDAKKYRALSEGINSIKYRYLLI